MQNKQDHAALEKHVQNMIDKYGSEKVKDVRYKVKNDQQYLRGLTNLRNGNAAIELHSYKLSDGSKAYTPVKVRYYTY